MVLGPPGPEGVRGDGLNDGGKEVCQAGAAGKLDVAVLPVDKVVLAQVRSACKSKQNFLSIRMCSANTCVHPNEARLHHHGSPRAYDNN